MSEKLLVVIGTADRGKAEAGTMYAVNALKHGWMSEVELYFFGPAESLLLEDENLQEWLREFQRLERSAVACRFLAERDKTDSRLADLGVEVDFVGERISNLIKAGYTPMVW